MSFQIGFQIKTLSNLIKKRIDYLSKDMELTGFQAYLLGYLIRAGSRQDIFQRDVEKKMEISRASVTSVLQLLERNGFIRRQSVEYDARLKKIVVTQKGLESNRQTLMMLEHVENSITEGISDEDLQTFLQVLAHMKKNLEQAESENDKEKE
ncbi:MAG: MarR family winged helix-turn-helix transcriptional regulator [Lachnospiraceae bacterium]|nr:MarR family winged helix-turn-helix transcriptional regulator [Lachnospiraceae bacterium]